MAYPRQVRSIDAFNENRFSSVINRFTRLLTGVGGTDVILFSNTSFHLTADSTSVNCVNVAPGLCIKDDVMIQCTDDFSLDFSDATNYVDAVGGMIATGTYLVVLQYTYARTLPTPKAIYKIIRDINGYYIGSEYKYILIGVVTVAFDGSDYYISAIADESGTYPRPVIDTSSLLAVDGGVIP